jgi:chromosome segregation ATPase
MSALMDLFDRITSRRRDRELSAQEQLAAAAKRHVLGETVDVGAVEEALFTTGQSIDDFRKLCESEAQRRKCFQRIENGASSKTKLDRVEQQIAAEIMKFSEIRSAHEARVGKLDEERREIVPLVDTAAAAKDWLLDPRNAVGAVGDEYREALDQEQQAESAVEGLQRVAKELRRDMKSCDDEIEHVRSQYDGVIGTSRPPIRKAGEPHVRPIPADIAEKIDTLEQKKTRASRRLSETQVELDRAAALVAPAKARVAAIRKKLLQP